MFGGWEIRWEGNMACIFEIGFVKMEYEAY
jgi:hypothetical protein